MTTTTQNRKPPKENPKGIVQNPTEPEASSDLLMPTLGELLETTIPERQYLLQPWLREHESCLLYSDAGVGKSLFALSAALAVAGNGSFLGWKPDAKADGSDWRVLYADGEMHIGDIQERARLLLDAVPGINRTKATTNLQFLARQQQSPEVSFPEITDAKDGGQDLILQKVLDGKFDLLILDNFSTLGRVADENAASSFDDLQGFLLKLKTEHIATLLVHHTGKTTKADGGTTFRGSSKLAATFEVMVRLERYLGDVKQRGHVDAPKYGEAHFRVHWDKLRGLRAVGNVIAKLTTKERQGKPVSYWDFTTSLDLLYTVKRALEEGLLTNQTEMATYCGLSPPAGKRIVERGIRYRQWTDANLKAWWALGKKRRKAGQTTKPTKARPGGSGTAWMDHADDPEDDLDL